MTEFFRQVRDGSAAVSHSGWDVASYQDGLRELPGLAEAIERSTPLLETAPGLFRDAYWLANQWVDAPNAQIDPVVPLQGGHRLHPELLREMAGTTEYRKLRAMGTANDPLLSAIAATGLAEGIILALPESAKEKINQAQQLQEQLGQLQQAANTLSSQAEDLEDLAQQLENLAQQQPSPQHQEQAADAAAEAFAAAQQAAQAQQQVGDMHVAIQQVALEPGEVDQTRRGAKQALAQAAGAIEELQEGQEAFMPSWGRTGPVGATTRQPAEAIALMKRLSAERHLALVARVAGRLIPSVLAVQKTKMDHKAASITDITRGHDLERMITGEMALLTDSGLEDQFWAKYSDDGLLLYQQEEKVPQERGPIIVAIDESGSMAAGIGDATRHAWAKAAALSILAVASRQKRWVRVLLFSDSGDLDTMDFDPRPNGDPAKRCTTERLLALASHDFGGGTYYDGWMARAIRTVTNEQPKADVILISDGLCGVSDENLKRWRKQRAEKEMRAYAILIGCTDYMGTLGRICDSVMTLESITQDQAVQTLSVV